jgi:hypothetical protein
MTETSNPCGKILIIQPKSGRNSDSKLSNDPNPNCRKSTHSRIIICPIRFAHASRSLMKEAIDRMIAWNSGLFGFSYWFDFIRLFRI